VILNHAHVGKGEAAGHPFRGNQYTTGGGGAESGSALDQAKRRHAEAAMNNVIEDYREDISDYKAKGSAERENVEDFWRNGKDAVYALRKGNIETAAGHMKAMMDSMASSGLDGLVRQLSDVRSNLLS
jgi:hypothetical protein